MKTSADSTGDFGGVIIAELNRWGVPLSKTIDLPRLPSTWRRVTLELAGALKDVGVAAQGCSLADVSAFCFSLFSPFREQRPFSNDNDESFFFSVDGKSGNFLKTDSGLVVSFITLGFALTLADSEYGVFIGFCKHPQDPGVSPKL